MEVDLQSRVHDELERILESPAFRNSHQSQRLLRHVVELSLSGRQEELRERIIGVELFGREAGFDTNEDPIVRVRANEVRKRLARYYEAVSDPPLRFELHPGSYRVDFRHHATGTAPEEPAREEAVAAAPEPVSVAPPPQASRPPFTRRILLALLATAALVALGIFLSARMRTPSAIDAFWEPLLSRTGRIIVCTGHPVVYRFSTDFMLAKRREDVGFLEKQTDVLQFAPGEKVDGRNIVPIEDQYIGLGSAHAVANVAAWLSSHGRTTDLRFGDDISFTELRKSPAVLVSFANRWTIDFMRDFRLGPELVDGKSLIRDRQTGKSWVLEGLKDNGQTEEDYVLVSRTFYSESGQCLITIAGLTQYGTQSAGEIVTDPRVLEPALAAAGPGWQNRNLQLLFHVRVVNHTPGPPRLVASHLW